MASHSSDHSTKAGNGQAGKSPQAEGNVADSSNLLSSGHLIQLQKKLGNRAVLQLMKSRQTAQQKPIQRKEKQKNNTRPLQLKNGSFLSEQNPVAQNPDRLGAATLHPSLPVQRMVHNSGPSSVIQRAVAPTIAAGTKATKVTLKLAKGEKVTAGSKPDADTDGYTNIQDLGLTKGGSDYHRWVRFHLLNEKAGGPGDDNGNLTTTTQQANHIGEWSTFEDALKEKVGPNIAAEDAIEFTGSVGYHGASDVYWKNNAHKKEAKTQSSDYPNAISAELKIGGASKASADLDTTDGLVRPQDLKKVPYWKAYTDAGYTNEIKGDQGD